MKLFLTITCLFFISTSQSQSVFVTNNGSAKFFSTAPLEDIEANNDKVFSLLDVKKKSIGVSILIKAFEFEKKLMQEHFNENYLESDKYSKAHFFGTINFNLPREGSYTEGNVSGEITIHGVKKPIDIPVRIEKNGDSYSLNSVFKIRVKDFRIKIPKVVVRNIAEVVEVSFKLNYIPRTK